MAFGYIYEYKSGANPTTASYATSSLVRIE
jgi:hypothetical protein